MNSQTILDALDWRYAAKKLDPNKKIDEQTLNTILESLRLAPSSFGIQGRGFVVVSNPELKQKLLPHAYNQEKVVEAPYVIVLCRRTDVNSDYIASYIESIAETRNLPLQELEGFKQMLNGILAGMDEQAIATWMTKQVYIALGFALETCALLGVDAGPMEGFNPKGFDEVLELDKHNLTSVVSMAIGYRSPEDEQANWTKVRWNADKVIIRK